MSRVRIKICGITNPGDADAACAAGADALGFVLWHGSPRRVDGDALGTLARRVPDGIARVGVFVNAAHEEIARAVEAGGLTCVQIHGDEDPAFCRGLTVEWYRAFRIGPDSSAADLADRVRAFGKGMFLLDTRAPVPGGSGITFDWRIAAKISMRLALASAPRLILAGGLRPENVGEAIRTVRPWGVDVSTGVEAAPGRKDPARIAAFVEAVRRVA